MSAASATARADGVYLRYTVEVWLPGALGGCVAPSWIQMAIRMGAYGQWGAGSQAQCCAHDHYSPVPRCVPAEAYRAEMGHSDLSQDAWLRWFDTSARVTT